MGYACPVCEDPQADAGHLANHLAFTAILGDDAHERWLDERVPEWGEMSEGELGEVVVEHVEETEFPQVFEDTVGGLEESAPDDLDERSGALFENERFGPAGHDRERRHGPARAGPAGELDPETEAIIEEAREMTREMLREEDSGSGDEGGGRGEGRADVDSDDSRDGRTEDAVERADGHADENA